MRDVCEHHGTKTAETCRVRFFYCRAQFCYFIGCEACLDAHEATCEKMHHEISPNKVRISAPNREVEA